MNDFIMYKEDDLKQDLVTDAFYVHKRNVSDTTIKFDLYFELQSLIAKIIIELEGKSGYKKSFKMQMGYNKYPDSYRFADASQTFSVNMVSFLVALQFALIAYNVNMRMIDEKENRLNNLL